MSISYRAIRSVAYKEFLHIYRDRRVLLLLLIFPPLFTLLFGHAFEGNSVTDIPALLTVRDDSALATRLVDILAKNKTFVWQRADAHVTDEADLLKHGVKASLVVPAGWGDTLTKGNPQAL